MRESSDEASPERLETIIFSTMCLSQESRERSPSVSVKQTSENRDDSSRAFNTFQLYFAIPVCVMFL